MKKFIIAIIVNSLFLIPNCLCQWVQVSNGIGTGMTVNCLAVSGNNIFAGTVNSGAYRSTDYGQSWSQTSLNNRTVITLVVSGSFIRAGVDSYNANMPGVYVSTDNGQSWDTSGLRYRRVFSLAISGNSVIAGTDLGVWLSTNNGGSWTQTNLSNYFVTCLTICGNNFFAGTGGPVSAGIWGSTDNGANWNQYYNPSPGADVRSFAVTGNNIYAGVFYNPPNYNGGVYLSTNGGNNWTQTTLNNRSVTSLAVSVNNLFAGTNSTYGVYVSTNNGGNWIQRNEGFSAIPGFLSLLIANNYIFAGTNGYSVWRRPLSELVGIHPITSEIPKQFSLSQNYPNPFNPKSKINYQIANIQSKNQKVELTIYNVLGEKIAMLVNEEQTAGTYEADWDASNYPSGVYYYQLTVTSEQLAVFKETKKMVLVK